MSQASAAPPSCQVLVLTADRSPEVQAGQCQCWQPTAWSRLQDCVGLPTG